MTLLYADDDVDDIDLLYDIVGVLNPSCKIINVRDGQQALDFLENSSLLPDIIILDINMPAMDGRSCLKFIKKDPRLNNIPVIIYSTGQSQQDIELCYQLGALAYIQKPFTFKEGVDRLSKFFR